jgi:hypothetical protein
MIIHDKGCNGWLHEEIVREDTEWLKAHLPRGWYKKLNKCLCKNGRLNLSKVAKLTGKYDLNVRAEIKYLKELYRKQQNK